METRYIQGVVSPEIADAFDRRVEELGLKKKYVAGVLAELFLRLPAAQQGALALALHGGAAFDSFAAAVDGILEDAICNYIPTLRHLLEQDRDIGAALRQAEVDAKATPQKRGRKTG